ncbi:MAG: helix-turn-helix domain-containing protein [Clostridia bacterium]|nr:helix-turn-helix domain-containing protein [Clostridia bacterium]
MFVQNEIPEYKNSFPFDAQLLHIRKLQPHYHDNALEFVYCLKGSLHFVAAEQDDFISAGHLRSIDRRDIHYLASDEDDNMTLIVHIDLEKTTNWEYLKYVFFTCESDLCRPYQQDAINRIKGYILAMALVHFTNGDFSSVGWNSLPAFADASERYTEELLSEKVEEVIAIMLQYFNWFNYENTDDYMNVNLYERFHRVVAYCMENYNKKISVSELAEVEHINRNYFSQFIGKTVFSSFSNMINYIRCYEADQILLRTNMPNYEVSFTCGFSDPQYFYTAFKKHFHCTPKEHRLKFRYYMDECQRDSKSISIVDEKEAAAFLKDYLTRWHIAGALGGKDFPVL